MQSPLAKASGLFAFCGPFQNGGFENPPYGRCPVARGADERAMRQRGLESPPYGADMLAQVE